VAEVWRIKVCLVGYNSVGKTSTLRRYVLNEFDERYIATLGATAMKKQVQLRSQKTGREVTFILNIFDIMGSRSFREVLQEAYFSGTQGSLAVCDVTRPETLEGLRQWIQAVDKVAGGVPLVILGNKADLVDKAKVTQAQLDAFAAEFDCPALLTSAKTGKNVEEAVKALLLSMLKRFKVERGRPEPAG
jgi:small GTP-binding protein